MQVTAPIRGVFDWLVRDLLKAPMTFFNQSNQYMPVFCEILEYFAFNTCVDHDFGAFAIRAGELWRGAKQATNQGAFVVALATVFTEVGATQIG